MAKQPKAAKAAPAAEAAGHPRWRIRVKERAHYGAQLFLPGREYEISAAALEAIRDSLDNAEPA